MNMKIKENIIKSARKEKGWSQQQLADICSLNLRTIQRVESTHSCSLETLNALLAVFDFKRTQLEEVENTAVTDKNTTYFNPMMKLLKVLNWQKNLGLTVVSLFLIMHISLYIKILGIAEFEGQRITWMGLSFGTKSAFDTTSDSIEMPILLYLIIISLSLLTIGIIRNNKFAALTSIFLIPTIYLLQAFQHASVTPVTLFVCIILTYVMHTSFQSIKNESPRWNIPFIKP